MRKRVTILYEDERCLVVSKAPGLLSVAPPKGSSLRGEPTVIEHLRSDGVRAFAVHRLDKETSGALLLAKDQEARDTLMEAFKNRAPKKIYLAVVQGIPRKRQGEINAPIKDLGAKAIVSKQGQPARTRYRVLETFGEACLVEVELLTGRHNQIRLHFADLGHPLVGERKYARGRDGRVKHRRSALHASRLTFTPPDAGAPVTVEAPLPVDLVNLREKLLRASEEAQPEPVPDGERPKRKKASKRRGPGR